MSETKKQAAEREMHERISAQFESPWPVIETAAERLAAEQVVLAELRSGCGVGCPSEPPGVSAAMVQGLEQGFMHLQLGASCSGCGRRVSKDYAAKE